MFICRPNNKGTKEYLVYMMLIGACTMIQFAKCPHLSTMCPINNRHKYFVTNHSLICEFLHICCSRFMEKYAYRLTINVASDFLKQELINSPDVRFMSREHHYDDAMRRTRYFNEMESRLFHRTHRKSVQ